LAGIDPWNEVAHIAVDEVILVAAEKTGTISRRPCKKMVKAGQPGGIFGISKTDQRKGGQRQPNPFWYWNITGI
jgi:hypothetical protein